MPSLPKILISLLTAVMLLLLALPLALAGGGQAVSAADTSSFTDIDSYIQRFVEEENIPGMAVVIALGDEVVFVKGYGVTSLDRPSPVTPNTVFDLASVSKSFTAMGVLLLRDDGLINLDVPLSTYLPAFRLADAEVSDRITVRHLLNQTSGLPAVSSEPLAFYEGSGAMEKMVAGLEVLKLNNAPGGDFEYANLNYALLGALIEEVSGLSFEDYMQSRVFTPLGLTNTTVYPEEAAAGDRAEGHQLLFGRVITSNTPLYRSAAPAGWVMSSADDMGQWLLAHLNGGNLNGEQLISGDSIEQAHNSGVTFELDEEMVGYGMGWFSTKVDDNLDIIWHGGDTLNFGADMLLFPSERLGVAVLMNSQNSAEMHSVASTIAARMLGVNIQLPTAPWWASWQAVDRMATGAMGVALLLVLGMAAYIWREWRHVKSHRHSILYGGRKMAIWPVISRVVPLVLLGLTAAAGFLLVQYLFGFNPYVAILIFGNSAPPGVWIAGLTLLGVILLWVVVLAVMAPFTAHHQRAQGQV